MITTRRTGYQSYLLRLRRGGSDGVWHASLQCTSTDTTYRFPNIDELLAFLQDAVAPDIDPDEICPPDEQQSSA
jgi:hypothetical protein